MNPLVSVVIPAFNADRWLAETLESVFVQTYPRSSLEVVVVDDGSTDRTAALAVELLSQSGFRYHFIHNDAPTGPSAARNRGWRSVEGTWVQFLDADDLLRADKIELQVRAAFAAPAEIAGVFSPWVRILAQRGEWRSDGIVFEPSLDTDPLADIFKERNFVATGSALLSRAWLERVNGYVERYTLVEDLDLLIRLIIAGGSLRLVPSDGPVLWYRQHAASLSATKDREFIEACLRNVKVAEAHWRATRAMTDLRVQVLTTEYFRAARFFAEHDADRFESVLQDIYAINPHFVPLSPTSLRRVSQLFGYRRAERIAIRYRRLKRLLQPRFAPAR